MRDVTALPVDLIVSNPKIRNGRPTIVGTTIRVQDIVAGHLFEGYSVDNLVMHYPPLTRTQVHAALAFYYEHRAEIDHQIEADDVAFQKAKAEGPGPRHPPVLR